MLSTILCIVRQMMSGFGDNQTPRADSIRLMEDIVLDYITSLVGKVSQTIFTTVLQFNQAQTLTLSTQFS